MKPHAWNCSVNMLILVVANAGTEANYKVVDTDYDNYAIVYDCSPKLVAKKGCKIYDFDLR